MEKTQPATCFANAVAILTQHVENGWVQSASVYFRKGEQEWSEIFGNAKSLDDSYLLGSISKPISVAAMMCLYDSGEFQLDDKVAKFIPEFQGYWKEKVTIRHLLTHVSGLPDQVARNVELRSSLAPLSVFVSETIQTPLLFEPGSRWEYSSMGILLACEIASRITKQEFSKFAHMVVLEPLGMNHSAFGMQNLDPMKIVATQVEFGALESGGGAPESIHWNWNSPYWRKLGAPWGGVHASARDVANFLDEFSRERGLILRPETEQLMLQNHNSVGMPRRGLGFDLAFDSICPRGSTRTFGHTGSTGTIAWSDPVRDLTCVVLTSLPTRALTPHPTEEVSRAFDVVNS